LSLLSLLSSALLLFNEVDNLMLFFVDGINNLPLFLVEKVDLDAFKFIKVLELLSSLFYYSFFLFLPSAFFYKATLFGVKIL
jgi:hypothetical protein